MVDSRRRRHETGADAYKALVAEVGRWYRRGWLEWWQMVLGGALVGLVCALPFAVGGTVLAAALAPAFFALGLLLGLLFWLLALWRNNRLVRRPADARGDGTGQ